MMENLRLKLYGRMEIISIAIKKIRLRNQINIFYNFETLKKSLNDLFGYYSIADKGRT